MVKKKQTFFDFLNLLVNTEPKRKLQVICSKMNVLCSIKVLDHFQNLVKFGNFLENF